MFLVIHNHSEIFLEAFVETSEHYLAGSCRNSPATIYLNDAANAGSALLLLAENDTYGKVSGEITLVGPEGCEWTAADIIDSLNSN